MDSRTLLEMDFGITKKVKEFCLSASDIHSAGNSRLMASGTVLILSSVI